jgi:hypothetical protein
MPFIHCVHNFVIQECFNHANVNHPFSRHSIVIQLPPNVHFIKGLDLNDYVILKSSDAYLHAHGSRISLTTCGGFLDLMSL